MDFDLCAGERELMTAIDEIVESCGGLGRAREFSRAGTHDADLDAKLAAADPVAGADLLGRVLVAERLAELGLATNYGLRAVLTAGGFTHLPEGPVALVERGRRGPVRFGAEAVALVVLDESEVRVCDADPTKVTPVRSSFGYPYADVDRAGLVGGRLSAMTPAEVRLRLRLALAAEISGTCVAGISHTTAHLTGRTQFGRPLATFQALRHRLADIAASAEATRWLTREAAWSGDARAGTRAAWYAGVTAATAAPELSQLCGARGFTLDFGLHVYTMRLEGLRLELGGRDRLAVELAATRKCTPAHGAPQSQLR